MLTTLFSGLLSALTLPTVIGPLQFPDLGLGAWFTLVPFYLNLRSLRDDARLAVAFRQGFLFGVAYYDLALYWIFIAMHTYGEVPVWQSLLGVALAVIIEAFFLGAATSCALFAVRRGLPLWISLPLAWVIQDYARNFIPFGGFSWGSLAYTQRSFLTLLQILDLTGVYGITFLLILGNSLLGEMFLWLRGKRTRPLLPFLFFLSLFSIGFVYGKLRLAEVRRDLPLRDHLKISLVQGNIPQEEKWLEERVEEIIARHLVMSEEAEKGKPALLIWPEAAYPAVIPPDIVQVDLLSGLKIPLLMGVVTYEGTIPEFWPPQPGDTTFSLYNSAVLIEPGGIIVGRYDKNHLVPMGEYVPLGRLLFFLNKIVPSISSFTPGRELNLLGITGARVAPSTGQARGASPSTALRAWLGKEPPLQFGVTICYEDLFPEISRSLTLKGAQFLVNLTNDAWYEHSSALFQHLDFSRFRAIENRRTMVRATNTGVTAFFSPTGEILGEAPVFKEFLLTAEVPVGGSKSFYTRFGDIFVWGCILVFVLVLLKKVFYHVHRD